MREILFRGKGKYNGEWVYGVPVQYSDGDWQIQAGHSNARCCVTVIPETVGQYTGLKDKNGTKIFEGDIVETVYDGKQNPNYVVVWDKDELDFKATNGKEHYKTNYEYLGCCDEIVVIGNIHSNPELLEV